VPPSAGGGCRAVCALRDESAVRDGASAGGVCDCRAVRLRLRERRRVTRVGDGRRIQSLKMGGSLAL